MVWTMRTSDSKNSMCLAIPGKIIKIDADKNQSFVDKLPNMFKKDKKEEPIEEPIEEPVEEELKEEEPIEEDHIETIPDDKISGYETDTPEEPKEEVKAPYQGPVQPGMDEQHFRETGIQKPIEEEPQSIEPTIEQLKELDEESRERERRFNLE